MLFLKKNPDDGRFFNTRILIDSVLILGTHRVPGDPVMTTAVCLLRQACLSDRVTLLSPAAARTHACMQQTVSCATSLAVEQRCWCVISGRNCLVCLIDLPDRFVLWIPNPIASMHAWLISSHLHRMGWLGQRKRANDDSFFDQGDVYKRSWIGGLARPVGSVVVALHTQTTTHSRGRHEFTCATTTGCC
jgi:hypothetical protein